MSIKVESAKESGRSFKGQDNQDVIVYEVIVMVDGATKIVDCMTKRVLDWIGKEVPGATLTPNKNPQYHDKLNIPKEGQGEGYKPFFGGGKKPYTPSFKDSKDAVVLNTKAMLLSYCKDLALGQNDLVKMSFSDILKNVETGFKTLYPLLGIDNLPESPKSASTESTVASQGHHHPPLKPALVAILKQKFKGWTNVDIVKYIGTLGFEMPHDSVSGDVYFDRLIEEEANTIINELEKV